MAMARTGSGKTACFLVPMFEKLKSHTGQSGARALIMSPTRELALQTLKFTKDVSQHVVICSPMFSVLCEERHDDAVVHNLSWAHILIIHQIR